MASLGASTTYPGGTGQTIQTRGNTRWNRGGGGGFNLGGLMNARANQLLYKGGLENQAQQFQLEEAKRAARAARAPKLGTWDSPTGIGNQMGREQLRQTQAQTRMLEGQAGAAQGGPPMRFNFSPNSPMTGGYMPDPNAMSGAQRQMFLPKESGFTGTPTPSDMFNIARMGRAGENTADMNASMQMRGLMQGGFLPNPGASFAYAGPESDPMRAARSAGIEDEVAVRRRVQGRPRPDARLFNPSVSGG